MKLTLKQFKGFEEASIITRMGIGGPVLNPRHPCNPRFRFGAKSRCRAGRGFASRAGRVAGGGGMPELSSRGLGSSTISPLPDPGSPL